MPRSLERYREMRDFQATPEPSGASARGRAPRKAQDPVFVVQRHEARRLHFDFRLEHDGVLLSWAVPKGPSMSVGVRRLAVRTEDHPVEYADFAGDIPPGQYGAGHVDCWDRGTWRPVGDVAEGLRSGHLKFDLAGKKLRGRFVLIRLKQDEDARQEPWLLIHEPDPEPATPSAPKQRTSGASRAPAKRARGRVHGDAPDAPPPPAPAAARRARARKVGDEATVAGVRISNPARPVPGHDGLTKLDLAQYYEAVAPWLLREIGRRPLSLVRCPGGDLGHCYFQRHPDAEKGNGTDPSIPYVRIGNVAALVASVQGGTIEFHEWGTTLPRIDRPDRITLDLDPDPDLPWATFREACELTRAMLDDLGLRWFVKTTGGKGLHFVLPITRRNGWDEVKDFARRMAEHLARTLPSLFIAKMSKAKRTGRVFVDYLRNGETATAVAAYSLRSRPGLPVAMPIAWEALERDVRGAHFNLRNVPQLLARREDPWADYADAAQSIAKASKRLGR